MARFESKYLLHPAEYHRLRVEMARHCRLDDHSDAAPDRRYLVRSLYFDGVGFPAYVEKVTGVCTRVKLRIRSYASTREATRFLKVEQKRRDGSFISKLVTTASLAQYDRFMATGFWGGEADSVLEDFERLVKLRNLRPVTVVEYDREAYFSRDGGGVRFSFDHDVRYARCDHLFPARDAFVGDLHHAVVFEIKCSRDDIAWVSRMVRDHGLKAVPNSKYANAVESMQPVLC